jgi:hypothetical protein
VHQPKLMLESGKTGFGQFLEPEELAEIQRQVASSSEPPTSGQTEAK